MDKDPKIIDISQHRGKIEQRRAKQEKYKAKPKNTNGSGRPASELRWFHYLQFFFVLAIIAYGMTICQSPN